MSSQRRIDASRANGRKSHGPVTPEGKARSSANSIRHGLLAKTCCLESESQPAFYHLMDSFAARFRPADEVEWNLVEEMVVSAWRLRRTWAVETRMLDHEIASRSEGDQIDRIAAGIANAAAALPLDLMHRYETRLHRMYQRALNTLLRLRAEVEPANPEDLPNEPNPSFEHSQDMSIPDPSPVAAAPSDAPTPLALSPVSNRPLPPTPAPPPRPRPQNEPGAVQC